MKRRTFLIGTGSTALGGSALLGSGAFTRVEAQRRVKIQVAHDSEAYLGLQGCPDSPNRSYTDFQDGHLAIEMSPENPTAPGGQGVNSDSRTWFDRVFQICNNGKEKACIWIEDDENWPRVDDDAFPDEDYSAYDGDRRVDFYVENGYNRSFIGQDNAVGLEVGDCICIGLRTNTKGLTEDDQLLEDLDDEIVIHADVDEDCVQTTPEEDFTAFQVDLAWGNPLAVLDSESEPPLTYATERRLMAWQHGTATGVASFENGARFAEYTDLSDLGEDIYAMGFGSLIDVDRIEFRDENGMVTETTNFPTPGGDVNSGNVVDGPSSDTPVEAEAFFSIDLDAAAQLADDLVDAADQGIISEADRDRGLEALNGGVDMTFTSYGGDEVGWNPPEFQVLFSEHSQFLGTSDHSLTVDLPELQ